MKKACIILAIAVLLLICPAAALANSAAPNPDQIDIAIDDYSDIDSVAFLVSVDGDHYEDIEKSDYLEYTRRRNERIVRFYNTDGEYTSFKLKINFIGGQTVESNPAEFMKYGSYVYDVKNNVLQQALIASRKLNAYSILFLVFFLAAPLSVTLLVEWLVSRAFRIKPGVYVTIANLITNPIMNILILVIFNNVYLNYSIILLLLEMTVAALEFGFYTLKYKQYPKKRLLLFTVTANLASWGVYYLISNGWF